MPDTQKVSQFNFDEVEQRLQTIKFDQGIDKCLLGNGTYGQLPTGGTSYDDTDIKNSIGTLTDLTTTGQASLVEAINELNTNKAEKSHVYDKYVVLCIAGQSNAVGYDESPVDNGGKLIYASNDTSRIKQLGFYGEDNLQIVDLGWCAQSMQDMRASNRAGTDTAGTKGLHLPLANLMLDYIPEDYGVLVLPISYGGTGFTSGADGTYNPVTKKPSETGLGEGTTIQRWGVNTAYYNTLKDRIIHALTLNEDNIFAGIIWCQGENDIGQASNHYTSFQEMTNALFAALNDAGLGSRVPKGEWDRDVWYNMETVSYWYSTEDCTDIWDNYKEWNERTYIEIPRAAESNNINGTGSTAGVKAKHFGNNAYQKVVAPRVLQKMIDMNTFSKKVSVIKDTTESPMPFEVCSETTRLITQNDIITTSSIVFTIDESTGKCSADRELQGTFSATEQPTVIFGDIYKMEWEVTRGVYWIILEKSDNNLLLLGLGRDSSRQLAKWENNKITILEPISNFSSLQYRFYEGDKVKVFRNHDGSVSVYRTLNNDIFMKWFDINYVGLYNEKVLGFACGISAKEFNDGYFPDNKEVLFDKMNIQKKELFPNNKFFDLEMTDIKRRLSILETASTTNFTP